MLNARPAVLSMPSYHPPLAGRQGLRLDFNENTDACSPRVLECLRRLSPEELAKYPERQPVESTLADLLKVDRQELLLTNGVDEAIHLLCEAYLDIGDEAIVVVPTYSMYTIYIKATGALVVQVRAGENFGFPANAVIDAITPRTRLVAIANPNNPTGAVATNGELLRIARSAPDAAVLVDEAYFEFHGETILNSRREAGNLFVTRTFSKAYGMAGLRIGVLVGNEIQIRSLRRLSSPYNVNAVALACVAEALADQSYVSDYVQEVLEGRDRLEALLRTSGIRFWPSRANFVLMRISDSKSGAAQFVEQMRQRGILVRDRSADEACEGCVRITVGRRQHVDRLLKTLQEVFEESAIGSEVPGR